MHFHRRTKPATRRVRKVLLSLAMTFSTVLLVLGIAALSAAFRSFSHPVFRKLGALGILATSFLVGYLFAGSWIVGTVCALSWFFLPWIEILTSVRRLRLPAERSLRPKRAPSPDEFPALEALTEEVEQEGFRHIEDAGWEWGSHRQFFRLFYNELNHTQTAICLIEQAGNGFYYLSLSSRTKDGTLWTTWNYPFSYSLLLPPHLRVNRQRSDRSVLQMHQSHLRFLEDHDVAEESISDTDPERVHEEIQEDLTRQISHNLNAGVLKRTPSGEIRYSWRGLFFLWCQVVQIFIPRRI